MRLLALQEIGDVILVGKTRLVGVELLIGALRLLRSLVLLRAMRGVVELNTLSLREKSMADCAVFALNPVAMTVMRTSSCISGSTIWP